MRTPPTHSSLLTRLASVVLFTLAWPAGATSAAQQGCPVFHCDAQATGVMPQPIVQAPTRMTKNNSLGTMKAQGCSGDGQRVACLVISDAVTAAPGKGTLKLLNGRTLQPVWGSADTISSYELDGPSAGSGQVPYMFDNGRIAAGDKSVHVLYEPDGTRVASVPLAGVGNNLGLTPVGIGLGVVSQTDGALTLIDMMSWTVLGSLKLRDPVTNAALGLVSPSSGSGNTIYAVARNRQTDRGFLMVVQVDQDPGRITLRSQFEFVGKTGASAVIVKPSQSDLGGNLVLLHVPGLVDDVQPAARLLGLLDTGTGSPSRLWSIPMIAPLQVSPTIDDSTRTLFYNYGPDGRLYQANYLTGAPVRSFNIRGKVGLSGLALNGHLVASQSADGFTLMLSGSIVGGTPTAGQYMIAFKPATSSVVWSGRTHAVSDSYTGAWTLVPSNVAGRSCPVAVGLTNGLIRVCDF